MEMLIQKDDNGRYGVYYKLGEYSDEKSAMRTANQYKDIMGNVQKLKLGYVKSRRENMIRVLGGSDENKV